LRADVVFERTSISPQRSLVFVSAVSKLTRGEHST
jgi:hypothetical protein